MRVAGALLAFTACPDLGEAPQDGGKVGADDGTTDGQPPGVDGATDGQPPDGQPPGLDGAGCGPAPVAVTLAYMSFMPRDVTVPAGCPVVWTNLDGTTLHTVTSGTPETPDGLFDSGEMSNGQRFTFVFETPGAYVYFCSTHPDTMRDATVTVE